MLPDFVVRDLGVWAPTLVNMAENSGFKFAENLNRNEPPLISEVVPKLLQRRLSPLAKAVFHAISFCIKPGDSMPAVFSSSHGEIARSLQMLLCLQQGEELSPTLFSLSVHNAISGLFSIAYSNRHEISVIAPGIAGLGPGFIEALGMLQEGHSEVLLVFYDEALPAFFPSAPYAMSLDFTCALALKLALTGDGLAMRFSLSDEIGHDGEQPMQLASFIKFLLFNQSQLLLGEGAKTWQWQKLY